MRTARRIRRLVRFATFGLIVAAVATELAKPAPERTWQGRVIGVVPYDFRPPTWSRIRDAYWNPQSEKLFSDRVIGVGWAVNLYKAKTLMEGAAGRMMGNKEPVSISMIVHTDGPSRKQDVVITRT